MVQIPLPRDLESVQKIDVKVEFAPAAAPFTGSVVLPCLSQEQSSKLDPSNPPAFTVSTQLSEDKQPLVQALVTRHKFTGSAKSILECVLEPGKYCILLGLGSAPLEAEAFYRSGAVLGSHLATCNLEEISISFVPENLSGYKISANDVRSFVNRFFYGMVKCQEYKSQGKTEIQLKSVIIRFVEAALSCCQDSIREAVSEGRILGYYSAITAALVNAPPNYCNCITMAETMVALTNNTKVECKILDENQCKELGMGAFLAVAAGSQDGARLVHLTYKEGNATHKVALVGKGITMDTGGYAIKPAASMSFMKCDMGGSAMALSTVLACEKIGLKDCEIHAIGMLCENMIDAKAYRNGDVLTASNGKTIEILNTDAEGRLALCDGLCYAQKVLPEGVIIDMATLTGAAIVALGNDVAAIMANNKSLETQLRKAADDSGEPAWPMPLRAAYKENLKSSIADLKNLSGPSAGAGSIHAGLFLEEFIEKGRSWAHLDIAGPAWQDDKRLGTGFGVALLVEYIKNCSRNAGSA